MENLTLNWLVSMITIFREEYEKLSEDEKKSISPSEDFHRHLQWVHHPWPPGSHIQVPSAPSVDVLPVPSTGSFPFRNTAPLGSVWAYPAPECTTSLYYKDLQAFGDMYLDGNYSVISHTLWFIRKRYCLRPKRCFECPLSGYCNYYHQSLFWDVPEYEMTLFDLPNFRDDK